MAVEQPLSGRAVPAIGAAEYWYRTGARALGCLDEQAAVKGHDRRSLGGLMNKTWRAYYLGGLVALALSLLLGCDHHTPLTPHS